MFGLPPEYVRGQPFVMSLSIHPGTDSVSIDSSRGLCCGILYEIYDIQKNAWFYVYDCGICLRFGSQIIFHYFHYGHPDVILMKWLSISSGCRQAALRRGEHCYRKCGTEGQRGRHLWTGL